MITKRIKVGNVGEGIFSFERSVSIEAGDKHYTLIVDNDMLQDDTLEVYVVAESDKEAIVDLPRETFTSGNRIRIPREYLLAL